MSAELQERPIGELVTGENKIYVSPDSERISLDTVAQKVNKPSPNTQLKSIDQPLDGVVDKLQFGSGKIRRRKRKVQVNILVSGKDDGEIMSVLEQELPKYKLPIGFGIDYGERFKERASNERGGLLCGIGRYFVGFLFNGRTFESILTPLIFWARSL